MLEEYKTKFERISKCRICRLLTLLENDDKTHTSWLQNIWRRDAKMVVIGSEKLLGKAFKLMMEKS